MNRCRRVGIDIRYLSHGLFGGVHTYTRRLLPALLNTAPDRQFVLYADRKAPLDWTPRRHDPFAGCRGAVLYRVW